ncbi:unnamed protein product [Meloidogyne enterolobii]|uniref:Uncharacterized protein n=1 Tax=Meloidogyne enterolobii TaxID=390850 RepID=A0ACB1AEN8_MELEN
MLVLFILSKQYFNLTKQLTHICFSSSFLQRLVDMKFRQEVYGKEDQEDSNLRPAIIKHAVDCPKRKSLTKVTNHSSKCNHSSSSKNHQQRLASKVSPNNSKSSKPTKSKTKERIHFFPAQEESTSHSSCIHEEDSLRRVTAYNRCTKKDPPRFVLSDDEDDVVVDQNEKNDDDVTPLLYERIKGPKPTPRVAKTTSSSTLKRTYWTQPGRTEQLSKPKEQPKSNRKRQMITGINKTPLSFIAKKMKRSPAGPFYTDGVEYRQLQDKMKVKNAETLPSDDNESSKTLDYSKEELMGIFPPREGGLKVKVDNNILEVIGNFVEVKLEGKVLWKASNEESNN